MTFDHSAIAGFESCVHYHGADAHFLQSLGYAKPMVDLGKVIDRFLLHHHLSAGA
jgi:hypothetical protein